MRITSQLFAAIAVIFPGVAKAFPAPESGAAGLNSSLSNGDLPAGVQPFEHYRDIGIEFFTASFPPETLKFSKFPIIFLRPFVSGGRSSSAKDFVSVLMCSTRFTGSTCIRNSRDGIRGLETFDYYRAPQAVSTRQGSISVEDLQQMMTLEEAFARLEATGAYTDPWTTIMISKFKVPPPGHKDEIFIAFNRNYDARDEWLYLGTQSGDIMWDKKFRLIAPGEALDEDDSSVTEVTK